MHWDQEPVRVGPPAVPPLSRRPKTRACFPTRRSSHLPHAATGDRSRSALRTGNSRATAGSWREPSFVFSQGFGTMNLTTRWERGSVSRSTSLQPQVLRVTDPRSGTPGSWRALFRFSHALGPGTRPGRTAGCPPPEPAPKNQGVLSHPALFPSATRCDRGPVAVRTSHRQLTGDGRFMERALFRFFPRVWDHEPDNAVGARLCEPQHVATTPSSAGHRPALRDARFMESPLSLLACIGTRNPSGSDRRLSPP